MPDFRVKIKTPRGQVKDMVIPAASEAQARVEAARRGEVISLYKQRGWDFSAAMTPADRQIFLIRLSAMLASKVGTSEALTLIRDNFTGKISKVAGSLLTYVEGGDDIAEAIARVGEPDFPANLTAMIKAGMQSGETWRALKDAAGFEMELAAVKKSSGRGLWSAVGGLVAAGATTIASNMWVGPMIMESGITDMAPGAVDVGWVMAMGNVMTWFIIVIMVVLFSLMGLASIGRKIVPVKADKLILKIPYYKDLVLSKNNFIAFYGLSLLVRSGVRLEDALALAAEAAPQGALRQDLVNARQAVKRGKPWAKEMSTLHPTDKAALISTQDRDQTSRTLEALAHQYKELYAQRLASFVPMLTLTAAMFLSLAGFVLFGTTIMPMLQMTQGLG